MKHEAWPPYSRLLGFDIAADQAADLDRYEQLLLERAVPLGLISSRDRDQLRERHIVDSLRAAPLLRPPRGEVADLGSGAGLPGIPLAIVLRGVGFWLIEARRRRVAFLELVVDSLRLTNVVVAHESIERVRSAFSVCLARALADPIRSWRLGEPLLEPDGRLLYWAGRAFQPASGTPEGAVVSIAPTPGLADAGPIVIMTRQ